MSSMIPVSLRRLGNAVPFDMAIAAHEGGVATVGPVPALALPPTVMLDAVLFMGEVLNHLLELFPLPAFMWIGDALLVEEVLVVIDHQRASIGGGHVAAALPQRLVVVVFAAGEVRLRAVAGDIVTQVKNYAIFSIRLPDPPLKIEDIGGIIGGEVGLDLLIVAARVLLHRNVYALGHVVIGVDYVFIDDRVLHIGPGRETQLYRLHTGRRSRRPALPPAPRKPPALFRPRSARLP